MNDTLSQFLRAFPLRGSEIMWFLGAGASASAGIPTAWHMIWEFKRAIYCSTERRPISMVEDLGADSTMALIQATLDRSGNHPPNGSNEEYSHYFELAYPSEKDRRAFIDSKVAGGRPSYGHLALAILMSHRKCDIVWTTNFDRVVEDAQTQISGSTTALTVATMDAPQIAHDAISERRAPLYVKLHGDYHSRALKNTSQELRYQDAQLRRTLIDACRTRGLAIVGYSGRDESIMDAMYEAASESRSFPGGLFWFHRIGEEIGLPVQKIIRRAQESGIEAKAVPIGSFDELIGDTLLLLNDIPKAQADEIYKSRRRVSNVSVPDVGGNFPVVRLNALRVFNWPKTCRLVECTIGGTKEVQATIQAREIVAVRSKGGVLAFGSDVALRESFSDHAVTDLDVHDIRPHRLRFESSEQRLLYDALGHALVRGRPLRLERRRSRRYITVSPNRQEQASSLLDPLRKALATIGGTIPATSIPWLEAIEFRLEYRLDNLWLLILPTIFAGTSVEDRHDDKRKEFIRSQLSGRYNQQTNDLINAWSQVLTEGHDKYACSTFDAIEGANATFEVGRITAFSYRTKV